MEAVLADGTASFPGYGRNMIEDVIVTFAPGIELKNLADNCRLLRGDNVSAVMNITVRWWIATQELVFLKMQSNAQAIHAGQPGRLMFRLSESHAFGFDGIDMIKFDLFVLLQSVLIVHDFHASRTPFSMYKTTSIIIIRNSSSLIAYLFHDIITRFAREFVDKVVKS